MSAIIAVVDTPMDGKENCSPDQVKKLSSVQKMRMHCLCGVGSSPEMQNAVSTAPYSETKASIDPAISYDRRTKLLMQYGLVAGITPMSARKGLDQLTLDIALSAQGGSERAENLSQD